MSADEFNEILRVVRETVRAEMRAEFAARADAKRTEAQDLRDFAMRRNGSLGLSQAQAAEFNRLRSQSYEVPTTMHGQPI